MASLSKHILLVQGDAPHAEAIVRPLDYCSDVSFKVEWVRHCAEGLETVEDAAAILEEATGKLAVHRGAQDYRFEDRLGSYLLPKALDSMIERAAISEALLSARSSGIRSGGTKA